VPRAAGNGCGRRGRRLEGETGQPPHEQGRGRGRPCLGSCSPAGERAGTGEGEDAAGEGMRSESKGRRDLAAAGSRPVRRERGEKRRGRERPVGRRETGGSHGGWLVWSLRYRGRRVQKNRY
jgi:hypothetical protein